MTRRILLIDDNPQIGRVFEVFLLKTHFAEMSFEAVLTAEAGVASLQREPADVVILDNYLGLHESYETPLKLIRNVSDAPVVLMTGSELDELGLGSLPVGLSGYIWKVGMTPASIEDSIERALIDAGTFASANLRDTQPS